MTASISVVVLCRDQRHFVDAYLRRLAAEKEHVGEVFFIDDASIDGSADAAFMHASTLPGFQLIRNQPAKGTVANMNLGLSRTRLPLVFFGAVDDDVLPGFFSTVSAIMARHANAAVGSCRSQLMDQSGRVTGIVNTPVPPHIAGRLSPDECRTVLERQGSWFVGNGALYRREHLVTLGGFDSRLMGFADALALWILALRHGACYAPDALVRKRNIWSGQGSAVHAGRKNSARIWRQARSILEQEHSPPFTATVLDACERRWFLETRYHRLWAAIKPEKRGPIVRFFFAFLTWILFLLSQPREAATRLATRVRGRSIG